MFYPFFALAAQSPQRQDSFRSTVFAHLTVLLGGAWYVVHHGRSEPPVLLGHILLIASIVEGAVLIGWRLTQLPKSQSLEFLLVSPLRPWKLLLGEALVGLTRLALVTLVGLPVLILLMVPGYLEPADLVPLLVMPFTWGAVTGLGLTAWAYEPRSIRRWAERLSLALVIFYLAVGVLVGEKLFSLAASLPKELGSWLEWSVIAVHTYTPFAVLDYWLRQPQVMAEDRMLGLEITALVVVGLLLARAAGRLQQHFHELHYRPIIDESRGSRGEPGDRPLSWWAVRRVTEYSGRINLWLAAGFGSLYAVYIVAGPNWPSWLGSGVFIIFEREAGIPGLTTALVVLAAVPAAFQYGLWDSNAQDRCRRLELLLLTQLDAFDYWQAAAAAAWRRGRGYFAVAVLLWLAAGLAGKARPEELASAFSAGVVLWALYFVLGFRAFARGHQANGLGIVLTVGLPLLSFACFRLGWPSLAVLLPPGSVYGPAAGLPAAYWLPGPWLAGGIALGVGRIALARCVRELRQWYELNHGRKALD